MSKFIGEFIGNDQRFKIHKAEGREVLKKIRAKHPVNQNFENMETFLHFYKKEYSQYVDY